MNPADTLTHLDPAGQARMVDVSGKPDTAREAVAAALVAMRPDTLRLILSGGMPKGDVLAAARIAGIMAAKRTSDLVPLCHPLPLSAVAVTLAAGPDGASVRIEAVVRTTGPTGVEMEALCAASIAALTVFDMCKAVDRSMRIEGVRVIRKAGGASGDWNEATGADTMLNARPAQEGREPAG